MMSQDDFRLSEAFIRAVMSSASIRHARNDLVFCDLTGGKRGCELQTSEKKKNNMSQGKYLIRIARSGHLSLRVRYAIDTKGYLLNLAVMRLHFMHQYA